MLVPVLLMLASGCDGKDDGDDGDDLPGAVLAKEPATVTECGEGPHPAHSSGSTGIGLPGVTMHWLAGTHSLGDSATLYLCQEQPIVVTVDSNAKSGASVDLFATLPNDFTGPLNGPTIHIADDRWSFDLPGRGTLPDDEDTNRGVILLGVLVCIVGAVCFVSGVTRNSGKGVLAAVVVFLLGVALVLVGIRTRPPPAPLCDREPQARECGM